MTVTYDASGKKLLVPNPGSPADQALKAELTTLAKKRHRPDIVRRLQDGKAAAEIKKQERKKGREIDEEHQFYKLSYGMMLGLRVSIGENRARKDLRLDDFMEVRKYDFPPEGSATTPPHEARELFKFKDYAPKVFRHLRERFGIDDRDYMNSLCGSYNFIEFISNSKSGQFFFYSYDNRYMIKTQSKVESKFLRRIMAHYYQHVMKNPHTYITRFYGMHRIKIRFGSYKKSLHFVVMQSVFAGDREIHEQYDLKGSTVGRAATEKEMARGSDCVYKDLDLVRRGRRIRLGREAKKEFMTQIRRDAKFLEKLKIMDYSVLLGIHFKSKKNLPGVRRSSVHVADAADLAKQLNSAAMLNLAKGVARARAKVARVRRGRGSVFSGGLRPHHLTRDEHGDLVRPHELRKTATKKTLAGGHEDIYTLESDGVFEGKDLAGNPTDEVYFMGIIDILQQYDIKKTLETWIKSVKHRTIGISSVDPTLYAERFVSFLEDYVD